MAIHPRNTRCGWEPNNARCCRVNDTYLHEPPVRDTNPVAPRVITTIPYRIPSERNVDTIYFADRYPMNPMNPFGNPPMGRYDMYDLRFDPSYQRWYWVPNCLAEQQPVRPPMQPVPIQEPYYCCAPSTCGPSRCCESFCNWLCGRRSLPPRRPPVQSGSYLQSLYRTPPSSDPLMPCPMSQSYCGRPIMGEPCTVSRGTGPCNREVGIGCDGEGRRKRYRECRLGLEKSASTSSTSNDCGCETPYRQKSACCPCPQNFMGPTCCPCQQGGCEQNICCACAQTLQRNMVRKCAKKAAKKKAKCSKCCCTQTNTQFKDKAVLTKLVEKTDACVCCIPKKEKAVKLHKTCIICKRQNMCPARCCPCILPMCLGNTCGQHPVPPGIEADGELDNNCNIMECTKNSNIGCENSKTYISDAAESTACNNNTCKNITVNWLKSATPDKNYPTTSNMSWINDMLLKKSMPTVKQKYFQNDDQFSSPLTGNTYNVNMVKIKNRHYRNYTALDPLPTDDTVDELRKAVENVKCDPEHRNLVTAVCDALLNNRTKSSFEGGDSSFLDEYTYTHPSDILLADPNAFFRLNMNNATFGGAFKNDLANNFNTFTQTSLNHLKPIPMANAQTVTIQPDLVNRQLITDPANPLFNEMTQTGADELFEEYMQKIRHSKLFSTISFGMQSEDCKIPVATYCRVADLGGLKDAPSQYDKPEGILLNNKDDLRREKFETPVPVHKPKSSETEKTHRSSNIRLGSSISTENDNQSDTDSTAEQDTVSAKTLHRNENQNGTSRNITSSQNVLKKPKRKRSATPSKSGPNISKDDENRDRSYDRHRLCTNSEDSVTKLSIHCPRNSKTDDHYVKSSEIIPKKKSTTQVKSATQIKSDSQIKSATLLQETNSGKKRKILQKRCSEIDELEKNHTENDKSQSILRFQSRIPIICPDKFRSSKELVKNDTIKSSDVLKQIETTISSLSFAGVKSDAEDTQNNNPQTRPPQLEDLYISNKARDHTFEYDGGPKSKDHFNSIVHYSEVNDYGEYKDESYRDGLNYNALGRNSKDDRNHLMCSVSNNEILISNVSYDSEGSLENNDEIEPQDEFSFNSAIENQKSMLSMIKEETESDVNINTIAGTRFLDINTSPFNFEISHHSFVDSCNSPFEMKKHKDRKHSALSCFSSHEESSEPYTVANGNSTNEEVERPRTARGIRWLFNM